MKPLPTRPYLLRAIYEWCVDSGFTPYLSVRVDERTRVPMEYVKDGEIVLNIGPTAVRNLTMDNDWLGFSARFNGASREIAIPVTQVLGIFARENGQGMVFPPEEASVATAEPAAESPPAPEPPKPGRPKLQVVK